MVIFSEIKRCQRPHFTQIFQKAKNGHGMVRNLDGSGDIRFTPGLIRFGIGHGTDGHKKAEAGLKPGPGSN